MRAYKFRSWILFVWCLATLRWQWCLMHSFAIMLYSCIHIHWLCFFSREFFFSLDTPFTHKNDLEEISFKFFFFFGKPEFECRMYNKQSQQSHRCQHKSSKTLGGLFWLSYKHKKKSSFMIFTILCVYLYNVQF